MSTELLLDVARAPATWFTIAVVIYLVLVRSPWPWTRTGGAFLAVIAVAVLALGWRHPELRASFSSAERLPILIMVLGSCAVCWLAMHQTFHRSPEAQRPRWRRPAQEELLAGALVVLAATALAVLAGAPLAPMAEAGRPATDLAAPWFLLGLRALMGFFDPWVPTLLLPLLTAVGLVALPYLDPPTQKKGDDFEERRDVVYFFLFVWMILGVLPMVTTVPSGAGRWVPFEGPELARTFSGIVWTTVLEVPPRQAWLRELPPFVLLGLYFFVLPRQLARWKPTRALFGRYMKRLGPRRFYLSMAFMQLWMLVPIKMYGRWLFDIGYFVYLPELGLNF